MSEENQVGEEAEATTAEIEATETEQVEQVEAVEVETPEEQKEPKGVQKRINELTRLRYEAEERERRERARVEELESRLKQQQPVSQGVPREEDYDDYNEYVIARAKYEVKQELDADNQLRQQAEQQKQVQQQEAEFVRRANEARAKLKDFDLYAAQSIRSPAMEEVILKSDQGPEVLYYLGQNAEESYRISQLDPVLAAKEIGKIEYKLSLPKANKISKAPSPPPSIGSSESVDTSLNGDMPMEEFAARWREQNLR